MTQPIHPMLERVARAMYDWRFPRLSAWEGEQDAVKDIYRADARAAIQALLEPDEGAWGKAAEPINTERWDDPSVDPLDVLHDLLLPLIEGEGA